ncbi:response regulator transcription factor [Litorivicinus lipolyticus]|uniref:response regulator transcription factor n=1 Tax=Litorivicinus lipolyticus TaxID=418701 RepID=UPI003B5B5075
MARDRVAVIEDNHALRESTCRYLSQAGLDVVGFDCAEAFADFTGECSLFVIDLNLPGVDGLDLAQRIRAVNPAAGIIMTTARSRTIDMVTGFGAGADLYLPKPVEPEALVAAIHALARKRQASADTGDFSGLELSYRRQSVKGPAREIRITEGEYGLLKALALSPVGLVEYWEAAEHMQMAFNEGLKAALEVRVVRLRKKIDAAGIAGQSIIAIRNQGYRLVCDLRFVEG